MRKTQRRWITGNNGPTPRDEEILNNLPEFEVSRDPKEWVYVEWCLKEKMIPRPPKDIEDLPSGWKPQKASAKLLPYFIERTKNGMVPVYLFRSHRGMQRLTVIRRIQGDIFLLEKELNDHVEKAVGRKIGAQINEPAGIIKFRGDFVSICKRYLDDKGM